MAENLNESRATLETRDGDTQAFQVLPAGDAPAPAVIVAQEAFGANSHVREVCRRFAREGYAATRTRHVYNADAANDAWRRTVSWLELRLRALASFPTED